MAYVLEGQSWPSPIITWSFETSGMSTRGDTPYSNPISVVAQQQLVEAAVADWQSHSGLTFAQVPDHQDPSEAPDIRIGLANLLGQSDSSDAIGTTDYYYYPSDNTFANGVYIALQDPSITPLQPDAAGTLIYSGTQSSFFQVILHELGHSLGLAHDTTDPDAVMSPVATANNRDLDADDIAGIKALYGNGPGEYDTRPDTLFLQGDENQYLLAQNGSGTLVVADEMAGRDGTTAIASDTTFSFDDGTALADPTGHAADVARLYLAVLGRDPDIGGLQSYAQQADGGDPLDQISAALLSSPEFNARAGGLSDMAFISMGYENVLHRAPDAGGLQSYASALANGGLSRAQLLDDLAQSQEGRQANLGLTGDHDDAEVTRLYGAALDRAPDQSGLGTYASLLDGGQSVSTIAQDLVSSTEFGALYGGLGNGAFVQALYQTVLHRNADAGGLANWTAQLNAGASRAVVVAGIGDSTENRLDTATVTHDGYVFVSGS